MSSPMNSHDLRRIFEKLDKNNDGLVSVDELNWLLERIGGRLTPEELEPFVGKSSLDVDEFLFFYESISQKQDRTGDCSSRDGDEDDQDLVEAFKVFDENGDGFISCEELQSVLSRLELWDGRDCWSMIRVYDMNLDGRLDFDEFKNMMLLTIA